MAVTVVEQRPLAERLQEAWETRRGWRGTLSSVDHKTIGLRYLVTAIFFLVVGGVEALLMRTQLAVSGQHLLSAGAYNELMVNRTSIRDRRAPAVTQTPQVNVIVPGYTLASGSERSSQGTELDQDLIEAPDN